MKDPTAQDLLWMYAQRRRAVDAEFSSDLEAALMVAGYRPSDRTFRQLYSNDVMTMEQLLHHVEARAHEVLRTMGVGESATIRLVNGDYMAVVRNS